MVLQQKQSTININNLSKPSVLLYFNQITFFLRYILYLFNCVQTIFASPPRTKKVKRQNNFTDHKRNKST